MNRINHLDVLFVLIVNLAQFLGITIACYALGVHVLIAALLSVAAILAFTKHAVRRLLNRPKESRNG